MGEVLKRKGGSRSREFYEIRNKKNAAIDNIKFWLNALETIGHLNFQPVIDGDFEITPFVNDFNEILLNNYEEKLEEFFQSKGLL